MYKKEVGRAPSRCRSVIENITKLQLYHQAPKNKRNSSSILYQLEQSTSKCSPHLPPSRLAPLQDSICLALAWSIMSNE